MRWPIRVAMFAVGVTAFYLILLSPVPRKFTADVSSAVPAQRKLVAMSWHCWSNYPCELWYLTRPARSGETPEKIAVLGEERSFDEAAEAKPSTQRGDVSVPSGWKVFGTGWRCGAGGCEVSVQLRRARKGEAAESYLFHNGTDYVSIRETP